MMNNPIFSQKFTQETRIVIRSSEHQLSWAERLATPRHLFAQKPDGTPDDAALPSQNQARG